MEDAGFGSVEVRSEETPLELGAPGEFLWHYVASTPPAAEVAGVDEERRTALEREFVETCRSMLAGGLLEGRCGRPR